jgi:hypothetical protein
MKTSCRKYYIESSPAVILASLWKTPKEKNTLKNAGNKTIKWRPLDFP